MKEKFDDNSYNNYSILSTNLTSGSNKFKKIYRMSSPVLIQSYGNNNFVVDIKYKKKNNNNDEYDFIENELKKTKKNKAYTTYTELSNEESVFFNSQFTKPNRRYYNDYTNFDEVYQNNMYNTNNTNYIVDKSNKNENKKVIDQKRYYYQRFKKEEVDDIINPSENVYFSKRKFNRVNNSNNNNNNYNSNNNNNNINKNNNELKYQRFCTSFISKNSNRNKSSSKKKVIHRKENKNNTTTNITNIVTEKKERGLSKTKNQLEDFNIDKLKEIGDCYALRHRNRDVQKKFNNMQNGNNISNTNTKNRSDKKEMHNGIIDNFINIEKKRKESKSKISLHNKTEEKIYSSSKKNKNGVIENKNSYEIKTLYDSNNNNRAKLLKVNRNEALLKGNPTPNVKKIKVNNIVKRKKYIFKDNSSTNADLEAYNNNVINKDDNENKDNCKNGLNNVQIKLNQRTYLNIQNKRNDNNSNYYNVYNRAANINKNKSIENLINRNMNHNYAESINIKNKK